MRQGIVHCGLFDGVELRRGLGVVIEDGRVAAVADKHAVARAADDVLDLDGATLAPGFVDLQVNGGGGVLFNDVPDVDALGTIAAAHRRRGTTAFLPTLITDEADVMRRAIAAVTDAIHQGVPGVLGIHLEGPHLNPARRGVHDASRMRGLDEDALALLCSLGDGKTVVTLAPETVEPAAITALRRAGVIVCAGHSAATYDEVRRAIDAGLSGFTHLFNAMSPLQTREPGMVGAALDDTETWVGIIADGHHVHPATLGIAIRAKARGRCVLVSDAMPTVGSPDATFTLHGREIRAEGGRCVTADGTLAGSDIGLSDAVHYLSSNNIVDRDEALRMASAYPAAALGLADELGAIRPGCTANLVALDDDFEVTHTWCRGTMEAYA